PRRLRSPYSFSSSRSPITVWARVPLLAPVPIPIYLCLPVPELHGLGVCRASSPLCPLAACECPTTTTTLPWPVDGCLLRRGGRGVLLVQPPTNGLVEHDVAPDPVVAPLLADGLAPLPPGCLFCLRPNGSHHVLPRSSF